MDTGKIMNFFREYWEIPSLIFGAVILVGAIRNRNWICDPTGAPDSQRYGRKSRRVIFFLLGVLLIVVGIWELVLKLK